MGAVNLARLLVPSPFQHVFRLVSSALAPAGEGGEGVDENTMWTYIRSDGGQSHVQGSAPNVVAPKVVERAHGLLVQKSDPLVDRVPLLVGSGALHEGFESAFASSSDKGGVKWDTSFWADDGLRATHLGLGCLAKLLADQRLVNRVGGDIVGGVPPLLKGRDPGVELQHGTVIVEAPECNLLDGRDVLLVRGRNGGVDARHLAVNYRCRDLGTLGHEVGDGGVGPGGIVGGAGSGVRAKKYSTVSSTDVRLLEFLTISRRVCSCLKGTYYH